MIHYSRRLYNGENITATTGYVYTGIQSTNATAGWQNSKADYTSMQLKVATLNATHIDYRIEGKNTFNGVDYIASVTCGSLNAITTRDKLITLLPRQKFNYIRLGLKVNTNASPNNVYAIVNNTELL